MSTQTYYVTGLSGPKVAGKRVVKGDSVTLTEQQARAELLSGALTTDKDKVDDPFGIAAKAAAKAAAAKAAADQAAAQKAAEDARALAAKAEEEAAAANATHVDDGAGSATTDGKPPETQHVEAGTA